MEPIQSKPWYRSRTIVGGAVAVVASIVGLLGITIDAATQAEATTVALQFGDLVTPVTAAVGGLVAIWGRIVAKGPIA